MGVTYSQFFPPPPTLTANNLDSQQGRVFIVTGGASGIGLELCKILYQAGATVYIAGRSKANGDKAIDAIKAQSSGLSGHLHFLQVSLDDLPTIKPAVDEFKARESRLDVLFNNAGVSNPPIGSLSPQDYDLTLATNCLGPYLLTQLLLPTLIETSKQSSPGQVRVVWTATLTIEFTTVPPTSFEAANLTTPLTRDPQTMYAVSKTGNWFLAASLADQVSKDGILSLVQNPGNLNTPIIRHLPMLVQYIVQPLLYKPIYGAYTELYSGLSADLHLADGGAYIIPWGRRHPAPNAELVRGLKSVADGGTGMAEDFTVWCDRETEKFR